jgi:hypothetical protein
MNYKLFYLLLWVSVSACMGSQCAMTDYTLHLVVGGGGGFYSIYFDLFSWQCLAQKEIVIILYLTAKDSRSLRYKNQYII